MQFLRAHTDLSTLATLLLPVPLQAAEVQAGPCALLLRAVACQGCGAASVAWGGHALP
jgi:hypothetical protein